MWITKAYLRTISGRIPDSSLAGPACFAGYGLRLQGFEGSGVGSWSPEDLRPRRGEGGERGEELAVAGLVATALALENSEGHGGCGLTARR